MLQLAPFIPWLPALAAIACGVCACRRDWRWLAPVACITGIASAFMLAVILAPSVKPYSASKSPAQLTQDHIAPGFTWIAANWRTQRTADAPAAAALLAEQRGLNRPAELLPADGSGRPAVRFAQFSAGFSCFVDPLTVIMLFVVTGIGSLVAIYAAGYMKGDAGYARFFAFVSLFIFAMTSLVLADNLVLLYLGWEGVGVCSYLLIGFYYGKDSAVRAAKKAFIVNRVGDLGFALGIFLVYQTYGSVSIGHVVHAASAKLASGAAPSAADLWVPFLLMLGAFGKSAQLPLHVWLPDAMEGPTPVSALIHAATMVTAGVYMICRLLPVFQLSPAALPTVAWVGGLTALFAGSIALVQNDIKRVFAYSTVSQLGYMFLGVGALSSFGAVFHLLTHAFFKALLFLTAGSVMHALAGQLDLRRMSGLRTKLPQTAQLMLVGCLALAGVFPLAGFFSKDTIITAVLERGYTFVDGEQALTQRMWMPLTAIALVTAFMTAFYTFRLWFRVFAGPESYEMGSEHHDAVHDAAHDSAHDSAQGSAHDSAHADAAGASHHAHEPHEMPWAMNAPLAVLALGSLLAGLLLGGWIERSVAHSTAQPTHEALHQPKGTQGHAPEQLRITSTAPQGATEPEARQPHKPHHVHVRVLGLNLTAHTFVSLASTALALIAIALAHHYHVRDRRATAALARRHAGLIRVLEGKYFIDELYHAAIVRPLRLLGEVLFVLDGLIIDGLVTLVGLTPGLLSITAWLAGGSRDPNRWLSQRPQATERRGELQGYGLLTLAGVAVLTLVLLKR